MPLEEKKIFACKSQADVIADAIDLRFVEENTIAVRIENQTLDEFHRIITKNSMSNMPTSIKEERQKTKDRIFRMTGGKSLLPEQKALLRDMQNCITLPSAEKKLTRKQYIALGTAINFYNRRIREAEQASLSRKQ